MKITTITTNQIQNKELSKEVIYLTKCNYYIIKEDVISLELHNGNIIGRKNDIILFINNKPLTIITENNFKQSILHNFNVGD